MNVNPSSKTLKTLNRQSIKKKQMGFNNFKNCVLKLIMKEKMLCENEKRGKHEGEAEENETNTFLFHLRFLGGWDFCVQSNGINLIFLVFLD